MYNRDIEKKERYILNANELFNKIRVKQVIGTLDIDITDITTDSRTASGESIFVASKS